MAMYGLPGSELRYEVAEARSRSVVDDQWVVYDEYNIVNGEVVPADNAKVINCYVPAGRSELPGEFAKIAKTGSEESILDFVKRYGLVGFNRAQMGTLMESKLAEQAGFKVSDPRQGDPMDWIKWHAVSVNIVMRLTDALNSDNPNKLKTAIDSLKQFMQLIWFYSEAENDDEFDFSLKLSIRGHYEPIELHYVFLNTQEQVDQWNSKEPRLVWAILNDPRTIALTMITTILNLNLEGIPRHLELETQLKGSGLQIKSLFRPYNLLDAIYWMLADAVVSGRVKSCESCGSPFIADTERRRYCYPYKGNKEDHSRCQMAKSSKLYRERKKKKLES